MKKLKNLCLVFVCAFLIPTFVMAKDKVNVNIFKSSSCPHCAEALNFFNALKEDSEYGNYFELVLFETNGNSATIKSNIELAEKVASHFGFEFSGVPLIVIGDKYFEGYISSMDEELKGAIKNAYESDDYKDVVAEIQGGKIKKSNFGTYMTILIFAVFLGGIAYLVYLGRKNVITEEVLEEKNERQHSTNRKKTSVQSKSTKKTPKKKE